MRPILLHGRNPGPYTGSGSNSWFIGGREPALIDAGAGEPEHLDELAAVIAAQGDRPPRVLVTHGHPDHAGGAPAVAARWPECRFFKFPWAEVDTVIPVAWEPLSDGDLVPAGDDQLWVLHTPGHAPDHVCFFEPRSATLFAGDLVINGGTVVIPSSHGGSLAAYLTSLRRILDLQPRRMLAGHGPPIEQPVSLLRAYIAHRLNRERQILDLLAGGPAPVATLVDAIYADLSPALQGAAGESVLAHLHKLAEEGVARPEDSEETGTVWRLA